MMKTAVLKQPCLPPEIIPVSTTDDALINIIGCTYQTRQMTWDQPVFMLFSRPESAFERGFIENLWTPNGNIAGPVLVLRKRMDGAFESLREPEISWVIAQLSEHALTPEEVPGTIMVGIENNRADVQAERQARRQHNRHRFSRVGDDLSSVIRASALIEQRLLDILKDAVPNPDRLGRHQLSCQQLILILSSLERVDPTLAALLQKLAELRNSFAHDPTFAPGPQAIRTLRSLAMQLSHSDVEYLELVFKEDADAASVLMSDESATLRAVYQTALMCLDPDEDPFT